jgi:hypothetical protein
VWSGRSGTHATSAPSRGSGERFARAAAGNDGTEVAMRRLLMAALACAFALITAPAQAGVLDARPQARTAGEDSPWPDTNRLRPNVRAVQSEVRELAAQIELMERSAVRYDDWETCLTYVPVSEFGDPDRQFGYAYDDRDGTGVGFRPALALDYQARPGREDYMFIDFDRGGDCLSDAPRPGGTADPASVDTPRTSLPHAQVTPLRRALPTPSAAFPARAVASQSRRATLRTTVRNLERRVSRMKRTAERLETTSERFDEWESCVSWVPVTEYGDPEGRFGYLYGLRNAAAPSYRTALAIDRSDWDDPDYMFLALVGGDRPGRTCQDEPGEAVD